MSLSNDKIGYKEIITDDILRKLHDLYDMNCKHSNSNNKFGNDDKCNSTKKILKYIYKYKKLCELTKYTDFFRELEQFRYRYNEKMRTLSCPNFYYHILSSFQIYNIKFFILMTFVMMLVISIFLTILYKFTTCGSYFRQRIIRKKYIYDGLNEENSICKNSKISGSMSTNRGYNILYNSEYYYH
ncbi:variable surface protein [Plasmodium gonderi]|uniref:Variable surface protein n=1 Tax=Plasmodium gonderi TaxID=77519 RepID=A0A1Y1JP83_PLAGO|nr:variable surface protein [Plasmodium gonderi]GAW84396.1 variable surface protein [Plasmodium gonderi]